MSEWLFDDTACIEDARLFVAHTEPPRFFGEVFAANDEQPIDGITIRVAAGCLIADITWIDDPVFDADELIASFNVAFERQMSVRGG